MASNGTTALAVKGSGGESKAELQKLAGKGAVARQALGELGFSPGATPADVVRGRSRSEVAGGMQELIGAGAGGVASAKAGLAGQVGGVIVGLLCTGLLGAGFGSGPILRGVLKVGQGVGNGAAGAAAYAAVMRHQ